MKKTKCVSKEGRFTRHRWLETKICERCKKQRNPAAGDKMFRFVQPKPKPLMPRGSE